MTTITDADREAAEAIELIEAICELADAEAIEQAVPLVFAFAARHREAALEKAAKVADAVVAEFPVLSKDSPMPNGAVVATIIKQVEDELERAKNLLRDM